MKEITFIIPTLPGAKPEKAISHILALNYPQDRVEILIVNGRCPSRQRNMAAARAQGELLYFLDDDSLIDRDALLGALHFLSQDKVVAVGGPALTQDDAAVLEQSFGAAVASFFGAGPVRARSRVTGDAREVRGEELILCNLLIRKDVFLDNSGFNVALYPNEENELLKRLRKQGYRFFYNPKMLVRRPRRKVIGDFVMQMQSYGQGRSRHIFNGFTFYDLFFLLPSIFVCYLLVLPFMISRVTVTPLLAYVVLAVFAAVRGAFRNQSIALAFVLLAVFPTMHIAYGIGVMRGLIRRKQDHSPAVDEIVVNPVKLIAGVS